ncbi:S46 family peptidase [Candidatus Zixiibacteriota bacterium]
MSRSPLSTFRPFALIALGFMLTTGCAGNKMQTPAVIEPTPQPVDTVMVEELIPALPTLADLLGPVSFDPDTVRAGRFDTGRMWTFDSPPMDWFSEAYDFQPDEAWFEHAHLGALRSNGGECTASFVSANGLMFTNHHCSRDYVTQVSLNGENLLEKGFYAATRDEERLVEGFFVDQLIEITDVTARIHAAMDAVESPQAKAQARQEAIITVGGEFDAENGMVNEVVELFNGGRYSIYTFKRYTDVRLVMAPELEIGFFGGDPDNFTYPRYNLDISFWRVYEDGEPVDSSDFFFKWSVDGPKAGDPVFVVGNPGSTTRLNTVAQFAFDRDIGNPAFLHILRTRMAAMRSFLDAHPDIPDWEELNNLQFNISNSEKAYTGQQGGLLDAYKLARKAAWETDFRDRVMSDPVLSDTYGDPWTEIAEARHAIRPYGLDMFLLRFTRPGDILSSALLVKAFLVQQYGFMLQQGMPADSPEAVEFRGMIEAPFDGYPELERAMLVAQLSDLHRFYPADDPLVTGLLGFREPAGAAQFLTDTTILNDPEAVAALLDGAPASIANATDPIIRGMDGLLMRLIQMQGAVQQHLALEDAAISRLARAVFDVYGFSIPPDATSSLRIQDGIVTGYPYNGTIAPVNTTFYGLYDRWASHGKVFPWALPERWQNPPDEFDLDTPINFVSTCDIIGGNSGSPVLNRDLEVVGIAFDGNIESLPGEFIFLPDLNRCVSVHSAGIFEAINDLFGYKGLAAELRAGAIPPGE